MSRKAAAEGEAVMFCLETKTWRWVVINLAALVVSGCSSRSDAPAPPKVVKESPRTKESTASQPGVVAATSNNPQTPTPDSKQTAPPPKLDSPATEAAADAPKEEPSAYDALEVQQIEFYKRMGQMLEPALKKVVAENYNKLREEERRARATLRLGGYKVSLNPDAERKLRGTLAGVVKADAAVNRYVESLKKMWPVAYIPKKIFEPPSPSFPARDAIRAAYEKALDEGAEFTPEIRGTLGKIIQFGIMPDAENEMDIDVLTEQLRAKMLEQTVTGDHIFLVAFAVRERGENIAWRRNWTRAFYDLVKALPSKARLELLHQLAGASEKNSEFDKKLGELTSPNEIDEFIVSQERRAKVTGELEKIADEREKKIGALQKSHQQEVEGYFHDIDMEGWKVLRTLDGQLRELQGVLDRILPDLDYRLTPLIPDDAPKDDEANVVPMISSANSGDAKLPTIEVQGAAVVVDAPAGSPKFSEVVKPKQVLTGTLRLRSTAIDPGIVLDGESEKVVVIPGTELRIQEIEQGMLTGKLYVPKDPGTGEAQTFPIQSGSVRNRVLSFSVNWQPFGGAPKNLEVTASMKTGSLSGTVSGSYTEGKISFEPKK